MAVHHGGGVGMGKSVHAGAQLVVDGTDDAARRAELMLWNDPATGVLRHADAGYDVARRVAAEKGLAVPMASLDAEHRHAVRHVHRTGPEGGGGG